jgi:hypothetical protein
MALAVMLSGQTYISLKDRIEHAHHHAHFANPLAGDVEFVAADHHTSGHHGHHDGTQGAAEHHHDHGTAGQHHSHDPADHQHGDASIVFLAAQIFVLTVCPLTAARCDTSLPALVSFSPRGPDHPPKPGLEIRV